MTDSRYIERLEILAGWHREQAAQRDHEARHNRRPERKEWARQLAAHHIESAGLLREIVGQLKQQQEEK